MTQKSPIPEDLKVSIINYLSGKWEECDSNLLTTWLNESPENSKLFQQLVDIWESQKIGRNEHHFDSDEAWVRLETKISTSSSFTNRLSVVRKIYRYAAIFILAFAIGSLVYYSWIQNQSEPYISSLKVVEYVAPYGSKTSLKLIDGSKVRLNAGTTLRYDQGFGIQNREIELIGEAYFEVAKNEKLPFVVTAKEVSVEALGTKFNVKAYPEEKVIETILLEGSVILQSHGTGKQVDVILNPNQKAIFNSDANDFTVLSNIEAFEISWMTDEWIIKNMRLEEFAKLLERSYDVEITFEDERIKNYEFGGTIKNEPIEQVLTAISWSAPLKYTITNKHVTLSMDKSKLDKYKNLLK